MEQWTDVRLGITPSLPPPSPLPPSRHSFIVVTQATQGNIAWCLSLRVHARLTHVPHRRYLKVIDKFFSNYISCFMTGGNVKFLLLHQPSAGPATASSRSSTSIAANPTSAATEEAIKNFFFEVYENWIKAIMNPFYKTNMEVKSPIFRQRVVAAGRKYL